MLFGISYQVIPELRKVVEAEEDRATIAILGWVLACLFLPVSLWHDNSRRPGRSILRFGGCLVIGFIASALLWIMLDVVREESFLADLLNALPLPDSQNAWRLLAIVLLGWLGWGIAVGEVLLFALLLRTWRTSRTKSTPVR